MKTNKSVGGFLSSLFVCFDNPIYLSCNNLEAGDEYFSFEQMVKRKFSKMFPDSPEDPGLLVLRTVPFQRSVLSVCVRYLVEL